MAGKIYGIGVGPGDPELLTIKAVRLIEACDVIAVPGKIPEKTAAYRIVRKACPLIEKKELLGIDMPMTKDQDILKASHDQGAAKLKGILEMGKDIAFLTLGDPCVYSTYLYLHERLIQEGMEAELISGIPSFCAAAARLNEGIAKKAEQIHILPASYQIEEALKLPGTKILMKAGKKLPEVKAQLSDSGQKVVMVENCGMEGEHIYHNIQEIPEQAGYYTLLFVKEEGEEA